MEFIINTPLVTLNEYIEAERTNKYKAASIKKNQTNKIAYLALESGKKLKQVKYNVDFIWYKPNNRHDHDNIAFCKKWVFDGLVVSGILKNDSSRFINNFTDTFVLDKSRNYISCKVIFVEV